MPTDPIVIPPFASVALQSPEFVGETPSGGMVYHYSEDRNARFLRECAKERTQKALVEALQTAPTASIARGIMALLKEIDE